MPGKIYGTPNKETLPTLDNSLANTSDKLVWTGHWTGIGTQSDFTVNPLRWWTTNDSGAANASVYVEFSRPTNLTHASMECDNALLDNYYPSFAAQLHCAWSLDNITWTELAYPAIFVSYYASTSGADNLPAYVYIPRTNIKAHFWRISIPHDKFKSDYLDNVWHISSFSPGTLDGLEDVVVDPSVQGHTNTSEELWTTTSPSTHQPWVNIGRFITTGCRVQLAIISKGSADGGHYRHISWMSDTDLALLISPTYDRFSSAEYQTCTLATQTGFATAIGHEEATTVWDSNHTYVLNGGITSEGYNCIGFTDSPRHGVGVSNSVTKTSISTVVHNPIGVIPDWTIVIVNDWIEAMTHPDYGDLLFYAPARGEPVPAGIAADYITLKSYQSFNKVGVVCMASTSGAFSAGTYVGDGSISGFFIDTKGIKPNVVFIKRLYDGVDSGMAYTHGAYTTDAYIGSSDYGISVQLEDTYFELLSNSTKFNELGATYLWWAMGE